MKNNIFIIAILALILNGCGINSALLLNHNSNTTIVELGEKNFKVVDKVRGEVSATYILGFGGLKNQSLVEKAKSEMYDKALLPGSSRVVINQTYERHITSVYPFYYKVRLIASGYVVEFQ